MKWLAFLGAAVTIGSLSALTACILWSNRVWPLVAFGQLTIFGICMMSLWLAVTAMKESK
jgi:uncharacterized membrane protein